MNKRQKYLRDVNWNSLEKLLKFDSCIVIWVCEKWIQNNSFFKMHQYLTMLPKVTQNSLIYQIALSDSKKSLLVIEF